MRRSCSDRDGPGPVPSVFDDSLYGADQLFYGCFHVNLQIGVQAGQKLAFGDHDDGQVKDSMDAAHKLGPFLDGESMAHDGHVKMARAALMKHILKADCCDHVKAGHTERCIPGTDQIA